MEPGFRSWWADAIPVSGGMSPCDVLFGARAVCVHARWSPVWARYAVSVGVEVGDAGWCGRAAGVNNGLLDCGERGGLDDGPGAAGQGDGVNTAELDGDAPPGHAGALFGDTDQQ
jgi:hypothetical protein